MNETKSKKDIDDIIENTIGEGVKLTSDFQGEDIITNFIYCQRCFDIFFTRTAEIFRAKMKTHGINSAILTKLGMWRQKLVTKEKMKQAYGGKLKIDILWSLFKCSINDDLETFFTNLRNQK